MIPAVAKPEALSTEQLIRVLIEQIDHRNYTVDYALRCLLVLATDLGVADVDDAEGVLKDLERTIEANGGRLRRKGGQVNPDTLGLPARRGGAR